MLRPNIITFLVIVTSNLHLTNISSKIRNRTKRKHFNNILININNLLTPFSDWKTTLKEKLHLPQQYYLIQNAAVILK